MSTPNFVRPFLKKLSKYTIDPKLSQTLFGGDNNNHFTKSRGNLYEFYLSGEIVEAEEYIDWFDTIRNAGPQDSIKIYINSCGGDLYTALQFLRVMGECEGTITTSVEGACMSAATMIFLSGHEFEVTPHSMFMLHNYSAGVFGKGGEMYDQLQFERAWSRNFLSEVYRNFLTQPEIDSMLDNKDIWLTSEEVIERVAHFVKALKAEAEAEETIAAETE
jgi:ATP-dependent protease ClpP protease subunit